MAQAESSSAWSIRSALLSVSDLDRSVAFYCEVAGFDETLREDQVAILERADPTPTSLFLREAYRTAALPSQQSLGVRTLSFDVGGLAELDRVEQLLRERESFRDREKLIEVEDIEMVRGYDPDRFSLTFVAGITGSPLPESLYRTALLRMYTLDL